MNRGIIQKLNEMVQGFKKIHWGEVMKEWVEKRIKEMKSNNVILLENWREYYNNKIKKGKEQEDASTQTLNYSGRGESPNKK